MSISLAKALLGTLSVGASGLGAYGIYRLASPSKTIRQVLQADSTITILDVEGNTTDSDWSKKVTDLGSSNTDPELEEYKGFTSSDENAKKSKVKEICKGLLGLDSREGSKLKQAKKWCTKDVAVAPQA